VGKIRTRDADGLVQPDSDTRATPRTTADAILQTRHVIMLSHRGRKRYERITASRGVAWSSAITSTTGATYSAEKYIANAIVVPISAPAYLRTPHVATTSSRPSY